MDNKFESMLEANRITHEVLQDCKKIILDSESINKLEIEKLAEFALTRNDVESSFRGYKGYPSVICISVNDEIIHGLPKEGYEILKGDLVSLDFGAKVNGYCGDAAISFINDKNILKTPSKKRKLVNDTKGALEDAVKSLERSFPDCKISDITRIINSYGEKYCIVAGFGGHGIGKELHDSSIYISNSWNNFHDDTTLKIGSYFTIEPMFSLGSPHTIIDEDGYTIKTDDGSLAAHFEYTIAITKDGVKILK